MLVDIGEVKRHIKPKADSTLRNMRKDDLIEYIRCLEHNYNVGATFLENQARYIESLDKVEVVRCSECKHWGRHTMVELNYGVCYRFHCKKHENGFCELGERSRK